MKNEIALDKEFYIISRSIDNAEICKIIKVCEDCFYVKLKNKHLYEIDESVELFATTSNGQFYFESIVKEVSDDIISVWLPISSRYLQRREYSRIKINQEIKVKDEDKLISSKIINISAGGLKIITKEQLKLLKNYEICLNIENKNVITNFQPIRIEVNNTEFIISGKFTNINNYDKISLVQYCFRKQIENSAL